MIFRPLKYKKYAEKSCQNLTEFQDNFRKKYDTDNYENWFYNQSSETLRLYSENKEIYFKYITGIRRNPKQFNRLHNQISI